MIPCFFLIYQFTLLKSSLISLPMTSRYTWVVVKLLFPGSFQAYDCIWYLYAGFVCGFAMLCTMWYGQGFLVDSIDRHLILLTVYFTGYVPGSVAEFCEVQLYIPNHCHNQRKSMDELLWGFVEKSVVGFVVWTPRPRVEYDMNQVIGELCERFYATRFVQQLQQRYCCDDVKDVFV